jgi:hypothetical protein
MTAVEFKDVDNANVIAGGVIARARPSRAFRRLHAQGKSVLESGSVVFRFFRTDVPAASEATPASEPFRINDQTWTEHDELSADSSVPAEYAPADHKRRDE